MNLCQDIAIITYTCSGAIPHTNAITESAVIACHTLTVLLFKVGDSCIICGVWVLHAKPKASVCDSVGDEFVGNRSFVTLGPHLQGSSSFESTLHAGAGSGGLL